MNKTIEEFKRDSLAVVEAYHSDVDHDIKIIEGGTSALFFAHKCGSHAIVLREFSSYPAAGEQVKYLFSMADREHLLSQVGSTLDCESVRDAPIVHYFDAAASAIAGRKVIREISHEKAREIVLYYQADMARQFRNDNGHRMAS